MSDVQAAPAAGPASFAGTPVRDLLAGAVSFGGVLLAANILSHTLKGVLEEGVRSGAVGMVFASVPAVYGIVRKITFSVGPKPAKPAPELAPWYITGMFAGACLFAWHQFFGFMLGLSVGMSGNANMLSVVAMAPALFLPFWAIVAGYYVYRGTRNLIPLAALLATLIVLLVNTLMNVFILPETTAKILAESGVTAMTWMDYLPGAAVIAVAIIIGMVIGITIGAITRARSEARLVSLSKKLDKDARLELLDEVRARVLEQA